MFYVEPYVSGVEAVDDLGFIICIGTALMIESRGSTWEH